MPFTERPRNALATVPMRPACNSLKPAPRASAIQPTGTTHRWPTANIGDLLREQIPRSCTREKRMSQISFALLEANLAGATIETLASRLNLTMDFVTERIEAARLCLVLGGNSSLQRTGY